MLNLLSFARCVRVISFRIINPRKTLNISLESFIRGKYLIYPSILLFRVYILFIMKVTHIYNSIVI